MKTYAVVMAAGKGTRMKSDLPKVVHEVLYKPMICHIVDELKGLGVDGIYVIVGHKAEEVKKLVQQYEIRLDRVAKYHSTTIENLTDEQVLESINTKKKYLEGAKND